MSTSAISEKVDLSNMVYIPKGEFCFGVDPHDEINESLADLIPLTTIITEEFWIDKTPVTYQQYSVFVQDTNYLPPIRDRQRTWEAQFYQYLWTPEHKYAPELMEMPIVFVSWYDALAYCEWAGKCLPTEVEWEKAARGLHGQDYPWGNDLNLEQYCNYTNSLDWKHIAPLTKVDAYPLGVSPYGCFDMLGNTEEWCWNSYFKPFFDTELQLSFLKLRQPPVFDYYEKQVRSAARSVRGSGRIAKPKHVSQRGLMDPWIKSPYISFRCLWYP